MNLYHDILMDHYRHPRNRLKIESPDFSSGMSNPSCGDSICIEGRVQGDIVTVLGFEGKGCVISQAAASLLTTYCCGKTAGEIAALDKDFMLQLVGIPLGPIRIKCALLSLDALQQAIRHQYCKKS